MTVLVSVSTRLYVYALGSAIFTIGFVESKSHVNNALPSTVNTGIRSSDVTSTLSVAIQLLDHWTLSVYVPGDWTHCNIAVLHTCDHPPSVHVYVAPEVVPVHHRSTDHPQINA